jgi:hypothetical protein
VVSVNQDRVRLLVKLLVKVKVNAVAAIQQSSCNA